MAFGDYYFSNWGLGYYFNLLHLVTSGTTLTIGPGITIHGQNGAIALGGPQNVSVTNQGTISCDVSGASIIIAGAFFNNAGTLEAQNGGVIQPSEHRDC